MSSIIPLNNHALIEPIRDHQEVLRAEAQSTQKGKLISVDITAQHLTSSAGHEIDQEQLRAAGKFYQSSLGRTVYYQQFADSGSQIEHNGKTYVLVPWYRLIGIEQ